MNTTGFIMSARTGLSSDKIKRGKKQNRRGYPPARRTEDNAAQRGRAQIFRGIHAGAGHFGRHGDMDFLAIPQHSQLLEHFVCSSGLGAQLT